MPIKKAYYKMKGAAPSDEKRTLVEHTKCLQEQLVNTREIMEKYKSETQVMAAENDFIKVLLHTYLENIKMNAVRPFPLLLDSWCRIQTNLDKLNTIQKLNCLFDYMDKLKQTVDERQCVVENKNLEINTAKRQLDFLYRKNPNLFDTKAQDSLKHLTRNQAIENQRITESTLHEQIQVCQKQHEETIEELQRLQKALNTKTEELKEAQMKITTFTINENKNKLLFKSLENIVKKTHSYESKEIENCFKEQLGTMSKMVDNYCQKYSIEEVQENANKSTIEKTLQIINDLRNEVEKYRPQVDKFQGTREDKTYLHIKEMLMRILEKLDNISSQNKQEIIAKRKRVITSIICLYNLLESKCTR